MASPALDTAYAAAPAGARSAATDATMTTAPPAARSDGRSCRVTSKAPVRFTDNVSFHSASDDSPTVELLPMPAAFTRPTSGAPALTTSARRSLSRVSATSPTKIEHPVRPATSSSADCRRPVASTS